MEMSPLESHARIGFDRDIRFNQNRKPCCATLCESVTEPLVELSKTQSPCSESLVGACETTSLDEKFSKIQEHWRPKVVAALNGQELRLVKFRGVFPWHHHDQEDEMFLVWRGTISVEFRDCVVRLNAGELCVVPRGVEHRTLAESEAEVLVFEPAATRNTGNVDDAVFTAPTGVVI
jgi:mannose-6-phosphate isomerase-like protein (cupin superfamily)